ncbi:ABC transporter ATP-binding protein [Desulfovibrio sulfodismutans]|uniref:ABC transporter ATP-binding protein n=1 Tax=Desulfolutivibrio sulfodismutans TaxID=63561 RepID=A0A7K3NND9_9BACT|nr:ABC transporter ATP-binding protein [Desulfolutivibrio sulfodismutans]NDY57712.1 ABC transporter ATP-binding protein [Desulfolutivibrio sulfodismutans]QLA10914.1 ATP-binding cassette domain-containing protein [Desulfolutivibrio sulfodismutans DSM 3696]
METSATTPVVVCRGLTKTYGVGDTATKALRGVDLDVQPGELLMLVGPSGCGKTTLISVIAGILNQDQGSCALFGQDLALLSPRERVRFRGRHIGFVFQAFNLVPCLTTLENIAVPLLINGVRRDEALRRAARHLDQVGLGDRLGTTPGQLSGGQQQRVAIARALVHDPGLVVCDEPTSALDHATGARVMGALKSLAVRDNRALVIVTHDSRIFPYADRIAHMDDGVIQETRLKPETDAPSCA